MSALIITLIIINHDSRFVTIITQSNYSDHTEMKWFRVFYHVSIAQVIFPLHKLGNVFQLFASSMT